MIIGIAGKKRAGKDTLAAGLSAALGLPRDSFAAPIRAFVGQITGMRPEELEASKETPLAWLDGMTPRRMMQTVGTEWGRQSVHSELWVRSLFARAPRSGVIVSDVRFPNEADAILARGGIVFRVNRLGQGAGDEHLSEVPLPDHLVTVELFNDSTPERLVEAALACLVPARHGLAPATDTGD